MQVTENGKVSLSGMWWWCDLLSDGLQQELSVCKVIKLIMLAQVLHHHRDLKMQANAIKEKRCALLLYQTSLSFVTTCNFLNTGVFSGYRLR